MRKSTLGLREWRKRGADRSTEPERRSVTLGADLRPRSPVAAPALLETMHNFGPKEKQRRRIIDPEQKQDDE